MLSLQCQFMLACHPSCAAHAVHLQHATCSIQHATRNTQHATCYMQHIACSMQYPTCKKTQSKHLLPVISNLSQGTTLKKYRLRLHAVKWQNFHINSLTTRLMTAGVCQDWPDVPCIHVAPASGKPVEQHGGGWGARCAVQSGSHGAEAQAAPGAVPGRHAPLLALSQKVTLHL